jgi:hypothetical protein
MKRFLMNILGIEGERTATGKRAARSRPARGGFVPGVEPLDDRVLPTCTFSVLPGGIGGGKLLKITGDNLSDQVTVRDNGSAGVNNVVVKCNAQPLFLPGAAVSQVVMYTRGGNDRVVYQMGGPVLPGVIRNVFADLGKGNDSLLAAAGNVGAGTHVSFAVQGGNGNDRLQANVLGNLAPTALLDFNYQAGGGTDLLQAHAANVNVGAGARLYFGFVGYGPEGIGPNGRDTVLVNYSGKMEGQLWLDDRCEDGGGRVNDDITLGAGSTGAVSSGFGKAWVRGGSGNDSLRFVIHNQGTAQVNAEMHSDGGSDVAIHTANVSTPDFFPVNQVVP